MLRVQVCTLYIELRSSLSSIVFIHTDNEWMMRREGEVDYFPHLTIRKRTQRVQ